MLFGCLLSLASPILGLALHPNPASQPKNPSATDPYQSFITQVATVFPNENYGKWQLIDCDGDGKADLVYIKTSNCASNTIEVHIALASTGYQEEWKQGGYSTVWSPPETDGKFLLVPYNASTNKVNTLPDLVFIKNSNAQSNSVEVHVASGASEWTQRSLDQGSAFAEEDNGIWEYYDWDNDGYLDLIYLKDQNTGSGTTEVHVASGATQFKTFLRHDTTNFTQEWNDGIWQLAPYSSKIAADLVFIKDYATTRGKVEVHIASQSSAYKSRIREVETVFETEQNGYWSLLQFDQNAKPRHDPPVLDLVYIKTQDTTDGLVEVHVVSGSG